MRQRVFRMSLVDGSYKLDAMIEVTGDFPRERMQQWQPGMWACRLHDAAGRMLAERTMHAPDHQCVVLDPNDSSGVPTAARFTADGPVVFQVRFPEMPGATRLDVIRITTDERPASDDEPGGQMLASIPLLQK
jgi:hypothetical protein